MQVSSEGAKDSFKAGSFISPPKPETSGEPLDNIQPSKVLSNQKSDQKDTLSPNPVTSDPQPTSEEHYEEGATRPSTRTAQTQSPEDDPGRADASFITDTSPSPESSQQGSKHPQGTGTSTAEAGSLRPDSHSNGDISTADGEPPDSTKGTPNGLPTPIINNSPTDPAAIANTAGDPDPGSRPASSSPSPHHDASPNDPGNPYPQPQTSPLPSNADGSSASPPPSPSNPLLQPPAPPSSAPWHSNPTTPQSDPSASKIAGLTASSLKGADPGSLGQGPFSLIDYHSQSQHPAPAALGSIQTASTAQAVTQAQAQAASQPPGNNTNTNTNTSTDSNTNISSTASGSRGRGKKAQPSSSSLSQGSKNSDGNNSSVLPFQNGGEEKRIGFVVWIVGLAGCAGAMFSYYFI